MNRLIAFAAAVLFVLSWIFPIGAGLVWNLILVTILGIEFTLIALLLGLAVFLQTRKRDFI